MKLHVTFHGLCLFTQGDDPSHEGPFTVLLPDARTHGRMKDGTTRDPHNAAILQQKDRNSDELTPISDLKGTEIRFESRGGAGTSAVQKPSIASVPHINRFAKLLELDESGPRPVGTVFLDVRGAVRTNDENAGMMRRWTFKDVLRRGHKYELKRVAESVTYSVDYPDGVRLLLDGKQAGEFADDTWLHIVNVCGDVTDITTRTAKPSKPGDPVPDLDFKWFYNLLKSSTKESIAVRLQGEELPVPSAEHTSRAEKGILGPDTPTCLCGFFCECDPPHDP